MIDRFGARAFIAAGALVLAASLVGVGRVESQAMLYVWFPLMAIGGSLAGAVPTALIVTRWFDALRARGDGGVADRCIPLRHRGGPARDLADPHAGPRVRDRGAGGR